MLSGKLRSPAPLNVLGQGTHRFLGNFGAFAAINRGFRDVDGGKNIGATAFALNPKRHRSLHRIFGTLEPAACDRLADEILLLGSEVYLHTSNVAGAALKSRESMISIDEPEQES